MYESTLTRRPLYSVWPHFRRTMTSSLTLGKTWLTGPVVEREEAERRKGRLMLRMGNVQVLEHRPGVLGYELLSRY